MWLMETTEKNVWNPLIQRAFHYYKDKYSEDVQTDLSELNWFPKVQPPNVPYDLTPYTELSRKKLTQKTR